MRELPELISLVENLKPEICYGYINKIKCFKKEYKELENAKGQKIIDVLLHGCYVQFQFSEDSMLVDLGDDGSFVITEDRNYEDTIVMFETENCNFFIVDKTLGTKIVTVWKDVSPMPAVGYNPLTKQFNSELFVKMLAENKCTIDKLIKNQSLITGIGPKYSTIILKRAGVTKSTKTSEIKAPKAREIVNSIKSVLREAIGENREEEASADI